MEQAVERSDQISRKQQIEIQKLTEAPAETTKGLKQLISVSPNVPVVQAPPGAFYPMCTIEEYDQTMIVLKTNPEFRRTIVSFS